MKFQVSVAAGVEPVSIERVDDTHYRINDKVCEISVDIIQSDGQAGIYSILCDGRSYEIAVREEKKGFVVELDQHLFPVKIQDPFAAKGRAGKSAEGEAALSSPMPGRVVGLKVAVGQSVKEGEGIVLVEAMKMENELAAPKDGKVKAILVQVGETVENGQDLVVIE